MNKHQLTLMGGPVEGLRISAALLHEAIGALLEGSQLATRFIVEGKSVRKGRRPGWLEAACAIEVTGLSTGSAVIAIEAPTLREAVPDRFGDDGQRSLFDEPDPSFGEHTVVDLFARVMGAVIERDPDTIAADRALLDACARFARISRDGFEGVRLDGLRGRETPLIVTAAHVSRIELLRDETPPPQAARVAGTLDTISASESDMILELDDGTKVPARLEEHDQEALRALFGERVAVSGLAHFRPSGRLLLLEVEAIERAGPRDRLFAAAPAPRGRVTTAAQTTQDESSGVSAFFGTWPGDESEDELLASLQAIG